MISEGSFDTDPPIGFMADEVQSIYPEFVKERSGILMLDYHGLLNKLEAQS